MPLTTLTFGCRLNAAESRAMLLRAEEAGLSDAILVNTCAVTAEAVRQARQAIRKAKRENPTRKIIVSGCAAQIEPEKFAAMPEVDLVLGNAEKLRAESYRRVAKRRVEVAAPASDAGRSSPHRGEGGFEQSEEPGEGVDALLSPLTRPLCGRPLPDGERNAPSPFTALAIPPHNKILVGDIFSVREAASHLADGFDGATKNRARAFVEVQNGCDHRCTFCIIPYGRGNSRSVPMGAIVDTIRKLVEAGTAEIVLTGVDITSYGADLPGRPSLGALVRKILRHVPELPRLRLSSIDSVEADAELLRAFAEEERLMPHLHLSLQSGDDMILKRMKRRHSRADAIRFCNAARRLRPDVVFGADLIAGFPTETDAMFQNTLSLLETCGLTFLHVFPFSPRAGTPAARMPQLKSVLVQQRARAVRQRGESALSTFLTSEVGKVRRVLVEKAGTGRTEHYAPVALDAGARGEILSARIIGADSKRLIGQAFRAAA